MWSKLLANRADGSFFRQIDTRLSQSRFMRKLNIAVFSLKTKSLAYL